MEKRAICFTVLKTSKNNSIVGFPQERDRRNFIARLTHTLQEVYRIYSFDSLLAQCKLLPIKWNKSNTQLTDMYQMTDLANSSQWNQVLSCYYVKSGK